MNYISSNIIDRVLYCTNIVEIISLRINLKKIGNKYISICPFHSEKNPSFIVNEDKKYYYCFGCKTYGNVINFLMRFDNISFLESIKKLSNMSGINLKLNSIFNSKKIISKKKYYFKLMFKLGYIYHKCLLINNNNYYIKNFLFNRGLNLNLIKYFFIGYSSKNIVNIFFKLFNNNELNFLIKLGFLVKINNKIYDNLYNRIIFPIYDIYNKIIAFSGRSININNKYKYINIKKNLYFNKNKCLYGFNFIKKRKIKLEKILIVEGFFDVITLNKYGIYYVISLLGSSICDRQINFLYYYTNIIIFCYDGDKSGLFSIKKTSFLLLKYINENKKCYFIFLQNNEDPDSFVKNYGILNFKIKINNAISLYKVLFFFFYKNENYLFNKNKIDFLNYFLFIIKKINSPIIKIFLYHKLFKNIGLNQNKIVSILKNYSINKKIIKNKNIFRYLISILLKYKYLCNFIDLKDNIFNFKNIYFLSLFLRIVRICLNNNNINIFNILKYFNNYRVKFYIEYLYINDFIYIKKNNEKIVFLNILNKLKIFLINKKIKYYYLKSSILGWNIKRKKKVWNLIKLKNFNL